MGLDVHADGRPLASPRLERVVRLRGVDAVVEGCANQTCNEADCREGKCIYNMDEGVVADLSTSVQVPASREI